MGKVSPDGLLLSSTTKQGVQIKTLFYSDSSLFALNVAGIK